MQTSPAELAKLQRQAAGVGLDNLADILCAELDGTKMQLVRQGKIFARQFQPGAMRIGPPRASDDEGNVTDVSDEGASVFEFTDEGVVSKGASQTG